MMVSCAFLMRCAVMCKQIRSRAVNLADCPITHNRIIFTQPLLPVQIHVPLHKSPIMSINIHLQSRTPTPLLPIQNCLIYLRVVSIPRPDISSYYPSTLPFHSYTSYSPNKHAQNSTTPHTESVPPTKVPTTSSKLISLPSQSSIYQY